MENNQPEQFETPEQRSRRLHPSRGDETIYGFYEPETTDDSTDPTKAESNVEGGERFNQIEPHIYVASLSDYNAGDLVGSWIRADQPSPVLFEQVNRMLQTSNQYQAEEWAIHDYMGFGAFRLSEYESLDIVARIAAGIAEHGLAFAHWVNITGTENTAALDAFDEHYIGVWASIEDYASDHVTKSGVMPADLGPAWLRPYVQINFDDLAIDLAADLETATDDTGVHVFRPEA